jgi:para-nitrobenzyl esterase
MKPKTLLSALLLLSGSVASAQSDPVVGVTGGQIRGQLTPDGGAAFKRIPYARPPLGELRWREPQPVEPWEGIREATRFSIACTQLSEGWNDRLVKSSGEDCLYLNVAAPQWPPEARHPVMVWIHGGSNTAGGGEDAGFDERTLVHRGVVLVTFDYRLGALGFLAHPELREESPHHVSGNYGLMDQIAALRWVQENIEKFGGDPGNVTAFGESAGSFDISLLLTSPPAKGLFQRAITHSGAVSSFHESRTKAQAEEISRKLAIRLKAPERGTIHFLRRVPAETIQREAQLAADGDRTGLETSVDGWVLSESPAEVFATARSMDVPLLVGSNAQEIQGPNEPGLLRELMRKAYGSLADRALEMYQLSGESAGKIDPVFGGPGIQWATDTGFRCPATQEAIWHSAAGRPAYQYEFAHASPGQQFTSHSSELRFLFGAWEADAQLSPMDRKVAEQMQAYWTNFARTGDPNGEGLPVWPKFTRDSRAYMAFTENGAEAKTNMRRDFCELWWQAEKICQNNK